MGSYWTCSDHSYRIRDVLATKGWGGKINLEAETELSLQLLWHYVVESFMKKKYVNPLNLQQPYELNKEGRCCLAMKKRNYSDVS